MKIALIGFGKMGKEIEPIALERGHEVVLRATSSAPLRAKDLEGIDVAIEFSKPELAVDNIFACFEANVPVVVGTTGWYNRIEEVRNAAKEGNHTILYSTNFSIGVNIVFHVSRQLAKIMNYLDEYEPGIMEIHHAAKLDKPSGTAITIAEGMIEEIKRKQKWVNDLAQQPEELTIVSERQGEVPGTHMINYTSQVDSITLIHEAKNRRGFALGAVKASEWLHGKKGIYTMNDFLKF